MSEGESSPPPPSKTKKETSPPPSSDGAAVADKTIKRKNKDRAPKDKDKKKKRSRRFGDDEFRSRFEAVASEGSDDESDVDDEEREVERYDRQAADAEYRRVQKSREERLKKMQELEQRAEASTRKLEEKERRRAEELELKQSGDEEDDDSDDWIVSDDSEAGYEAGDEPVAAGEMSKNIFETDTPLFSCQCSKGKEREVVCDVMAKYFTEMSAGRRHKVRAAFFNDSIPGVVYFESNSDAVLRALIMGIMHLYPSKLERIPNESRVDVITIKQTKLQLDMGSFVTLKQFPYKGDVGLVVAHKPNEQTVDVLLRPLLNKDMSISRNIGSNRASLVKRKFSPNLNGLHLDANTHEYIAGGLICDVQPYKSMRFVGPFELRTVKIAQMHPNAEPSGTQLSDFQNWLSAARDEQSSRNADYAGRSDSDQTLLSHLHYLLTSGEGQAAASARKIEHLRGDKVLASTGDFVGLTGTVAQVRGDEIKVTLDSHLRTEGIPDELLFNISDLVKRFDIGDSVVVAHGPLLGSAGIVIAIDSVSRILTINHGSRNIQVRMEDCCNPAAAVKPAALSAPPKFKSRSLVECHTDAAPPTRGVVVECSGGSVTVLDAKNLVTMYDVEKVSEVMSSRSVAKDSCRRTVKRGDTVQITNGPNVNSLCFGTFVTILFVIGEILIVFSPAISKIVGNRGLMAVPSSGAEFLCKQKKKTRRAKKHRGFNPAADTVFSANGHASSVRVVAQQTVKPPVRGGSRFWSSGKPSGPPLGFGLMRSPAAHPLHPPPLHGGQRTPPLPHDADDDDL